MSRACSTRAPTQAEALGLDDVITICSTCTGHMRASNKELLEETGRLEHANAILGKFNASYKGTVSVQHLLWMLIDDIGLDELSKMVVNPLNGLRSHRFTVATSSVRNRSTAGNRPATRIRWKI
jgi:succinate dehydrogenase / fumarate reductase cytochrome b subunit